MKKIILFFALLCSITVFSQRGIKTYLVQLGTSGAATWTKTLTANDSVVDLSVEAKDLNTWFTSRTSWTKGDQIWLTKGTFNLSGTITIGTSGGSAITTIRGGFAGSEADTLSRAKGTNPWDFTNTTILDGNNSVALALNGGITDGLTIQHFKGAFSGGGTAAVVGGGSVMKNCIVTANAFTGTGTQGAGGVRVNGGKLLNSHIFNNTSTSGGGGIGFQSTSTIDGCLIENNTGTGGGGLYVSNSSGATISNCIIKSNTASTGTGGGLSSYFGALQTTTLTISNTQFISNTAATSGGAISATFYTTSPVKITGCTFTSNVSSAASASNAGGGAVIIASGNVTVDKCTFTGNKTELSGGGALMVSAAASGTSYIVSNSVFNANISGDTSPANGSALYLGKPTTVNNCVLYNNTGSSVVYGYPAAKDSINFDNVTVASNVKLDATASGIYLGVAVSSSIFKNCIFYNSGTSPIGYSTGVAPTVTYSGFDQTTLPVYAGTGCINSIVAGSFKDAVNGDFHLVAGSTAIDAGTSIPACSPDIDGVIRPQGVAYDMGAYEASSTGVNTIHQDVIVMGVIKDGIVSKFNGTIQVLSVSGSVLRKAQITVGEKIKLTSGMYIIHLSTKDGDYSQKIVL